MKHLLIILSLLLFSSPLFGQSEEKPCYISVNSSDEFNQTLLSNISISIISQYFKEIKSFPPSGLGGSDNCIYDVTVSSEGGRTFVTLQGKDMNLFGDSNFVGIDGFQQSLLKSLYRSLSTPLNSSQSDTTLSKIPHSCKTNRLVLYIWFS